MPVDQLRRNMQTVGNYDLTAALPGFQTIVRSGIELAVGRNAVVDVAFAVGDVTQAITVAVTSNATVHGSAPAIRSFTRVG